MGLASRLVMAHLFELREWDERHQPQERQNEDDEKRERADESELQSTHGGRVTVPRGLGRKSRWSDMTMITNRSDHIPMFTKIDTDEERRRGCRGHVATTEAAARRCCRTAAPKRRRSFSPNGRATKNWYLSYGDPLYQAIKSSMIYE